MQYKPYMVAARKYRPQTFDDLIGQDVMVRTLRNAFAMDRIAQAYMLTGVRGVGKTTTARILARALNYENPGVNKPTLDMPGLGVHCEAIMASRHVDVLEMDAASNTGIDDIREIIEAVRYKPASARYRVFIIDEVHMLSKAAFNGLLKTLEEPPPHVKFIFATTEIRKVPVTVLSRCQRFDLRRVEQYLLVQHFEKIAQQEGRTAEKDALFLIARAAEGSVRDGISLLDQAMTLSDTHITASLVLDMLGIASRSALFEILTQIFEGKPKEALIGIAQLYDAGGDPLMIASDLADLVHAISRLKVLADSYPADFSQSNRESASLLASRLGIPHLSLAWQMLLKGTEEVSKAARPLAALEMLIIRMCYASGLPSPASLVEGLHRNTPDQSGRTEKLNASQVSSTSSTASSTSSSVALTVAPVTEENPLSTKPHFTSFEDIVEHAATLRDIKLKVALEEHVELVQFGVNFIELHLLPGASSTLPQELSKKMMAWTGQRCAVSVTETRGSMPLGEARRQAQARDLENIKKHPAVKRILSEFPNAEIKAVRSTEQKT